MNPSYFRIKLNIEESVERLCDWCGSRYTERIDTTYSVAVDVSLDKNGQWKGSCLYVYENKGWTVFEDLSGSFSFIDLEQWLKFSKKNEFMYAGYNDAIVYAEMIVIVDGVVTKYFIEDDSMPEDNVNTGYGIEDINNWIDVAEFVDRDEFLYSEKGVVLIF